MNKKSGVKGKLKTSIIVILSVLMIAFVVLCAIKIKRIQNENNIIGTWMQGDSEEVLTFHDHGSLIVNQDMPEVGNQATRSKKGQGYFVVIGKDICYNFNVF